MTVSDPRSYSGRHPTSEPRGPPLLIDSLNGPALTGIEDVECKHTVLANYHGIFVQHLTSHLKAVLANAAAARQRSSHAETLLQATHTSCNF